MISVRYDFAKLPVQTLLKPLAEVTSALTRLDERIARSPVGEGILQRLHFADACASLWLDGELVHVEDLVLHDAGADVRTPTHELTIARDVFKTRRRIADQASAWSLSDKGLASLCKVLAAGEGTTPALVSEAAAGVGEEDGEPPEADDPLAAEFRALDAVLARSDAAIAEVRSDSKPAKRNPLVYEPDRNEEDRLEEWKHVLAGTEDLPPVLRAIVLIDAWNRIAVSEHAPWLGRLLAAAALRQEGITTSTHLPAVNLGLKSIPVDRRRNPDRNTRLSAFLHGLLLTAELGLKEHDRLLLAKTMLERKLSGRRANSSLPALVELILARPVVSARMIAQGLKITPQAALRLVNELGLREMTGRGRFRAWGVL